MSKAEVSLAQYTTGNTRPVCASVCQRVAGAIYLDQKQRKNILSLLHPLLQLCGHTTGIDLEKDQRVG